MINQNNTDLIKINEFHDEGSDQNLISFIWNSHENILNCISITKYLENNGEKIKKKYINFIYSLGRTKINNLRITEHSEIKKNYNLWWMSLLSEKSHYKSEKIKDILKLIALEEMLLQYKPKKITLNIYDKNILNSVIDLCKNLNINFSTNKIKNKKTEKNLIKKIYKNLPFILKGFIFLFQNLNLNLFLKKKNDTSFFSKKKKITCFSYLVHINQKDIEKNNFNTGQWGPIPELLNELDIKSNWIHHFIPSNTIPTKKKAINYLINLNSNKEKNGFHQLINENLNLNIFFKVLINYIRLIIKFPLLLNIKNKSILEGSKINFWHLIKNDLYDSYIGYTSVQNLFWIELFDELLKKMPYQEKGFYTQENQGWEKALIIAWKKYNHGDLHGINNGFIRFWDTRFFEDKRTLEDTDRFRNPLPDKVILTDRTSLNYYLEYGYNEANIIKAETIRYFDIINKINQKKINDKIKSSKIKILILGDYVLNSTHKMLLCLESINSEKFEWQIKSHPACIINVNNYKKIQLKDRTNENLTQIISEFNLVIAPAATFAVFEAYLANIDVTVFLDREELNISPLRGFENINFVYDKKSLKKMLDFQMNRKKPNNKNIFWYDENLEEWKKIFK